MRHLAENFAPGDRFELSLLVEAELIEREPNEDGQLMNVRVAGLKNNSNGKPVLWTQGEEGAFELAVAVDARQRLAAVGLSTRQRAALKQRFADLTQQEAVELLREIAGTSSGEVPSSVSAGRDLARLEPDKEPLK